MYIILAVLFLGMAVYYFIMARDVSKINKEKKKNNTDKTENIDDTQDNDKK